MSLSKSVMLSAAMLAAFFSTPSDAAVLQLINNGDFETGTFASWSSVDLPNGTGQWAISTPGALTPISGVYPTAPNPMGGAFYAITDQTGPGTHALIQSFVVPANMISMTLSFQMFVNNQAGISSVNPAGLDHNVSPNQHGRVDLLTAAALPFSTALADVVSNLYLGNDPGVNPNPYLNYSFDLSSLTSGSTYQLRFAETDNQLYFNIGVDNVSILATTREVNGTVPEPTSIALWVGLLGIGLSVRNVRQRSDKENAI